MLRYVILLHETPPDYPRGTHYDVMFESAGMLRTWAIDSPPAPACDLAAEQLADHRLAYLEFEGEVSGGRGRVSRWDGGAFDVLEDAESRIELRLSGGRLAGGRIVLTRPALEANLWRLCYHAD